jgi:hypothetical protein
VLYRVRGRGVRTEIGIEVTQDSDANGIAHRVIVLEQVRMN